MTIPGVGPVVALGFVSTIDIPGRFKNSKAVGPALGLTPVLNQSGESSRVGRVSLCGDQMMRTLLYEAAQVMLTAIRSRPGRKAQSRTPTDGLSREVDPLSISDGDLTEICNRLNSTPRKCLGYKTPAEVFRQKLLAQRRRAG
ncbi:hypothetical protein FHW16_004743 [Phyllobacterium myrsinacearum]|uniref:Transposase IS116/IS110/IS902 C-terminal domain-containing protein n=1 Tax=Phyllobacterium myrsinacearum TaxID=28101 RepID=A0A839ES45_9HYPH|nr:hypothetical protein [Phyllobacterium myrsinacearum]